MHALGFISLNELQTILKVSKFEHLIELLLRTNESGNYVIPYFEMGNVGDILILADKVKYIRKLVFNVSHYRRTDSLNTYVNIDIQTASHHILLMTI